MYVVPISGVQSFEICRDISKAYLHLKFTLVNHQLINHPIFPSLFLEHTNLTRAIIGIPVNAYLWIKLTISKYSLVVNTATIQNEEFKTRTFLWKCRKDLIGQPRYFIRLLIHLLFSLKRHEFLHNVCL